jgi:AraC family transcriptional regulator
MTIRAGAILKIGSMSSNLAMKANPRTNLRPGLPTKTKRMGDLAIAEFSYPKDAFLANHVHNRAAFCCTLAGAYEERYAGRAFLCAAQGVVFRPAGEAHSDRFGGVSTHCFVIELPVEWLRRSQLYAGVLSGPKSWNSPRFKWLLQQVYREYCDEDPTAALAAEGLIWQLIAEVSRHDSRREHVPQRLEMIREVLQTHFAGPPKLTELADLIGVHPAHLSRSFHSHYGCTIRSYVRQLRVEFACHQLAETDEAIAGIALKAGFAHQAHFSTAFKRQTGRTPAEVRRFRMRSKRDANFA